MTGVGPSVLDAEGKVVTQVMRPELIIEVSNGEGCDEAPPSGAGQAEEGDDTKCVWTPYEFQYKVGNVARAPPWVAPHQPRLDWQMWFAALDYDWHSSSWFASFLQKLALNQPSAVHLVGVEGVPFKEEAPRFIRVRKLVYDFTSRYQTTQVLYEAPKGTSTDLNKKCAAHRTRGGCEGERAHCRFVAREGGGKGVCENRRTVQHKLVKEDSPDWWVRRDPSLYSPVLKMSEFATRGYLPEGHSLPNMPIVFGGEYAGKPQELGGACERACRKYKECLGYTYQPSRGTCYLKSVSSPVRGLDCVSSDCWHFGVVQGHVRLKHAHLSPQSRAGIVKGMAAAAALMLLARAAIFKGVEVPQVWDADQRRKLLREARVAVPPLALLALLLALVYYTAHHMGQVFIPFLLAAGTGMMLSCYLYHVETNLEQTRSFAPACDVNEVVSCSAVANSAHSHLLLGTRNSLLGILYFFVLIILSLAFEVSPDSYWILLLTSGVILAGFAMSLYLQCISLSVLRVVCPVCTATFVINAALLLLAAYITHMQRAFLEYDDAFLYAMQHSAKHTHGD